MFTDQDVLFNTYLDLGLLLVDSTLLVVDLLGQLVGLAFKVKLALFLRLGVVSMVEVLNVLAQPVDGLIGLLQLLAVALQMGLVGSSLRGALLEGRSRTLLHLLLYKVAVVRSRDKLLGKAPQVIVQEVLKTTGHAWLATNSLAQSLNSALRISAHFADLLLIQSQYFDYTAVRT